MDSGLLDRTSVQVGIPVPVALCRRVPKTLVLADYLDGQWALPGGDATVDVGACSGACLSTDKTGPKSCEAVRTDTLRLEHAVSRRTARLSVVRECACVCTRVERCPSGRFWNAWHCRCQPKARVKPCKRATRYTYWKALGTSLDVGACGGECEGKGVLAACQPLTFVARSVAADDGRAVSIRAIGDCGCSDCRVKPRYRLQPPL